MTVDEESRTLLYPPFSPWGSNAGASPTHHRLRAVSGGRGCQGLPPPESLPQAMQATGSKDGHPPCFCRGQGVASSRHRAQTHPPLRSPGLLMPPGSLDAAAVSPSPASGSEASSEPFPRRAFHQEGRTGCHCSQQSTGRAQLLPWGAVMTPTIVRPKRSPVMPGRLHPPCTSPPGGQREGQVGVTVLPSEGGRLRNLFMKK